MRWLTCFNPCTKRSALYVLLFTRMGFGRTTFYYLSDHFQKYAYILGLAIVSAVSLLYIFDCYYWSSKAGILVRKLSIFAIVALSCALVLCVSGDYPYGPISLFIFIMALWLAALQKVIFH